jgi:exopolysaccharide biosynthesis polyprenyl glycosylphosphotransferase
MNDRTFERAMLLLDVITILAAVFVAHALRQSLFLVVPALKPAVPANESAQVLVAFLPTWVWCADRLALNSVRTLAGPLLDLLRVLLWTQGSSALALAFILTAAQAPLNRSLIGLYLVLSTIFLLVGKGIQRQWARNRHGRVTALVVGADSPDAAGEIERLRGRRAERFLPVDPAALRARLRAGAVDEVVLPGGLPADLLRPLLLACEEVGVPALVQVDKVDLDLARPRAEVIGTTLYLAYDIQEPDRPALLVKVVMDVTAAALLLVFTLPLLLLTAVLVKVTSKGPVLFVQRRGGLHGRPFSMLKFRTMREGAESEREALLAVNEMDGPVFKVADDPRVTGLGRLLRRTSIDELPQLVNVLFGHMSLVGPRPLPVGETESLSGIHRRRLSVRPGITGLWQVSGRSDIKFEEWMSLDLQYVQHWSLGLDLAILLRTIPALLSRRGAL